MTMIFTVPFSSKMYLTIDAMLLVTIANKCRIVKRVFVKVIWEINFSQAEQSKYYY